MSQQYGRGEKPQVRGKEGGNDHAAHGYEGRCTVERADQHEAGGSREDEFSSFCERWGQRFLEAVWLGVSD